jgi:hypothetical protein
VRPGRGEIVETQPEIALRLGAEHLVGFVDLAGFGSVLKNS